MNEWGGDCQAWVDFHPDPRTTRPQPRPRVVRAWIYGNVFAMATFVVLAAYALAVDRLAAVTVCVVGVLLTSALCLLGFQFIDRIHDEQGKS